jgi:DNA-binding LytR/AlgR family response regulator
MALKQIASSILDLEFVAEFESARDAFSTLESEQIDLILLDIEMPEITGLDFARQISTKKMKIIFTTGKTEYAIDAFETNVVDYIVKPVTTDRLQLAVDKLRESQSNHSANQSQSEYFFIKDKGGLTKVFLTDVLYFEALGDYVKIHTKLKSYALHSTLKNIEAKLNPSEFIRIHRSSIVALKHIDRIEDGAAMIDTHSVSIADSYKTKLNEMLNIL